MSLPSNEITPEWLARSCFESLKIKGSPLDFQVNAILNAALHFDVLVVAPTGSGKSFCFQALPIAFDLVHNSPGLVLVISPLLGLIENQVKSLNEVISGYACHIQVPADFDNGSRIFFLTPEIFITQGVIDHLNQKKFRLHLNTLVFDEVHCLLDWGDTFRPSYLEAARKVSFPPSLFQFFFPSFSSRISLDWIDSP